MTVSKKTLANGFSITALGFGTYRMGVDPSVREAEIKTVRAAVEAGISHIDTAEVYGDGDTERFLKGALAPFDRASLFIATKAPAARLRPEQVISACHRSLDRLGTDYIDLYMPHARTFDVPLNETMSAFDQLADEGVIRNVGLSNFGASSQKEAQRVTKHPIVVNQVHYNVSVRAPEVDGLLEACQTDDVLLNAWRPVQRSYHEARTVVSDAGALLESLAQKYGKTPLQVSLNWLLSQKNVIAMVKSSKVEHLEENLGAAGWTMEPGDIELLRREFPHRRKDGDVSLH